MEGWWNMQFPSELKFYLKGAGVKAAWMSENKPISPRDCPNCGGLGVMSVFVATDGPYESPANPYAGSTEAPQSSHWDNGKWWIGEAHTANCPVCHGVRHVEGQELVRPVEDKDKELISRMKEQWYQKD